MKLQKLIFFILLILLVSACEKKTNIHQRPLDPWAFRSVLDRKPRMITLALDSNFYVAYDLASCTLYKAWKGGVSMEGTAYSDKKNVQPSSWGTDYLSDSIQHFKWNVERGGKIEKSRIVSKGYFLKDNQIHLKFILILSTGDTIRFEERPEYVENEAGDPGLERSFKMHTIPEGITVSLLSTDTILRLKDKEMTQLITYFKKLPTQTPPRPEAEYDHRGRYFMEKSDCLTCHEFDKKTVGPSFQDIAQKYPNEKTAVQYLTRKVKEGGSGVWGTTMMNPHPSLQENEIKVMLDYILSLRPNEKRDLPVVMANQNVVLKENIKPGFGASLEGAHPSYDVFTLHKKDFKPRVGGMAFLPDGRLLVTTWDTMGGVYVLSGVETGDTAKITVKRIASGLSEPLGIEVVDDEIYVLQKHELTHLKDLDGDEIIDEYEAVCNSWGVSGDFHEFAFGLVYKDGYFYAALSMAMRLMSEEKQQPDRGKTIKISKDGSHYEWINYGLRTPNGIGLGVDNELFVTDNQGEWLPANKLIHVKKGEFLGMQWGLPDTLTTPPKMSPPAIWLPENEIGNSPSEPVLMRDGPYRGQMLHGDVTHGGIKRDFLEKIDGEYQGAVFRFSQGLEAGVNRLRWGPDGALYVGGVGMVGGWSWKEKQFGLQKMKYNERLTFEMLAVRAKPDGFEIEFTDALDDQQEINPSDFFVQQWWYLSTANYGGPKMDLVKLNVNKMSISSDRRRVLLQIDGLKKEHVVYFRIPEYLKSSGGQSLWSSEAWYTLNNIPE
ncbi:MAG: c-type cytochrome [Cyclobacteriaceae bacterium]